LAGVDDLALVALVKGGDREAALKLIQRYNRTLWRIARGILRDETDAEEAVQDAYVRAFTSLSDFRGESAWSTWLARIAINEALRRASRRRVTVDLGTIDEAEIDCQTPLVSSPPDPEQAAARRQVRRLVEQAVDTLPTQFRAVFVMRVLEQMSVEETAATLGIPAATVKTRLHRANQQLRAVLGAEFAASFEDAFPFAGTRCEQMTAVVLARLDLDGADGSATPPGMPTTPTQEEIR
jgi:RNA polymerase sigma-70 factor (ECF subfamily)